MVFPYLLLLPNQQTFAQQTITVNAKNESLNKVLISIRDNYQIKLSFNDAKLAQYKVDVKETFINPDQALKFLLKDLPFTVELVNDVFIISSKRININAQKNLLVGHVFDKTNQESLPFSSISINNYPITTDLKGNFSYLTEDSVVRLKVSYLGYYKLDTLVQAGNNLKLELSQSSILMPEVVLSSTNAEIATNANSSSGNIKINQSVGEDLPGSSDNSIYNFLRLQPGILAAGEQANDLIVWGSSRGQTKVSFDGFTIFGVKNFNDNIGAVNPLMTKDLSIKKGGYGVEQGDRVGGIVDITGIEGSKLKPSLKIGINNLTINAEASMPLFKNTSLVIAGRQTYYNLYNSFKINQPANNRNGVKNVVDLSIIPDYTFKDINLKFSGKSEKGDNYFISLFSGKDELKSAFSTNQQNLRLVGSKDENNQQFGGSAFYNKVWRNGAISSVTLANSGLDNEEVKLTNLTQEKNGAFVKTIDQRFGNEITEQSLKLTYQLPSTPKRSYLMGFGYIKNKSVLAFDDVNPLQINNTIFSKRYFGFSENAFFVSQNFKITPGLRADFDTESSKLYLQPRLSTSYKFNQNFRMTASWGIYNQFIAYNGLVDDEGNFRYQWTVSDGNIIPVYQAQHWVTGAAFERNGFSVNADFYYKTTEGLTRFVQNMQGVRNIIKGDGRATGLDLLFKKDFKKHNAWIGYTLNNTEERFRRRGPNHTTIYQFERAPQDQRHELKFAALFNLSPFYFSANYVYGSGFRSPKPMDDPNVNVLPYNRFDTAITYKIIAKKYQLDAGISVLNVFNTQNLKPNNVDRIPTAQLTTINIYSNAVPFTPTLFLKFSL